MTSSILSPTRRGFLAGAAGGTFVLLHPYSARAQAGQVHLRIMETTDLHVHVMPYDYYSDKPVDTVGLARTAARIAEIRAEATNSMLVDNGDFLQGNPMGDYIAYEKGMKEGDLHPVIAAMNTVPTGIDIRSDMITSMIDGGIRMPSVPEDAIVPVASGRE